MLKTILLATLVLLLTACQATANQPAVATAVTLPPNVTPLVTRVGGDGDAAQPKNHLEAIKTASLLRVGASADYPPFEFLDSNGSRTGFDIDLMEEIAGRMGLRLEWIDLPFNDLIPAVQAGKIDAAISAFEKKAERDQLVDFTEPYYTSEDAFLSGEGFTGQIIKPEDAASYTVGVQAGTIQEEWLKENLVKSGTMPETNMISYDSVDTALADLSSGKIHLLMADYIPAQDLVQRNPGLKIVYHGIVTGGPIHIVIPEGDAELAQAFNQIIRQLQAEGFIQELAFRYISTAY